VNELKVLCAGLTIDGCFFGHGWMSMCVVIDRGRLG
jgi:hypothetical protein